ncbi:hypothetical protein D3C87_1609440 [compost metagenome]
MGITIPKVPEEDPVIADIHAVSTVKLIKGSPGIEVIKFEKNSNPGAAISTEPKATAEAVAKIGAMEPLAPILNVRILSGICLLNSAAANKIATINAT